VFAAATAMAEPHPDYLKLGIFPGGDPHATISALAPLAGRCKLVGVLFADRAPDLDLLPHLAAADFAGAMLDTADKQGGRLLDHMDLPALRRFVLGCGEHNLASGLAGGLEAPDVPRVLVLGPGLLGFRGALCGAEGRAGAIDAEAVRAIRALIPPEAGQAGAEAVDYRLLAARGYAPDTAEAAGATDRVFIHDLVLPVRIGAYVRERAAPQRVRFAVAANVLRAPRPSQDMRDVFSYDVITDAIRMLTDAHHIALVETLAERIAAALLAHPRIVKVAVKVEKLDLGAGVAGVAIERTRADLEAAG
jgi:FolB domain-containing protein